MLKAGLYEGNGGRSGRSNRKRRNPGMGWFACGEMMKSTLAPNPGRLSKALFLSYVALVFMADKKGLGSTR
jgi:hypothetical protein